MIKDRVSIIIPVYGCEKYLNACIDSILNQDGIDIEIICVHDESPDKSLEILKEYKTRHGEVIVIFDQKNTGGATAINNGIDLAKGEYLTILDCDDFLIGNSLYSLYKRIVSDQSDMVISVMEKYQSGKFSDVYDRSWIQGNKIIRSPLEKKALFQNGMYTGILFRSELIKSNKIYMKDGLLYADRPFMALTYAYADSISVTNIITAAWRQRDSEAISSITDRIYDKAIVDDLVNSVNHLRATLINSSNARYLPYVDEDTARRLIWHLRRGWSTWRFNLDYHRYYYNKIHPYFNLLDDETFANYPLYSNVIAKSLKSGTSSNFLLNCLLFFFLNMIHSSRETTLTLLKDILRSISDIVPITLVRWYRSNFPNYRFSKKYRKYLEYSELDKNTILFESYFGKTYSGNPKYIYEYIHDNYPEMRCIWVHQGNDLDIPGKPYQVLRGSDEYYFYLSKAKYWINNIRFPVEHKKRETVYLQTWHGTPLKKLGYDIPYEGPEADAREGLYRESRNWNYLLSQNRYSSSVFTRAFRLDSKVVELGYPCNDIFHSSDIDRKADKIRNSLQIQKDKKVVLYAPTWRDTENISGWTFRSQSAIDYKFWIDNIDQHTILLIREHHLVDPLPIDDKYRNRIIDVSAYDDVSELLLITDCLITDYSSIFFDYLNLQKLIVFYMYDLDIYMSEVRSLYLDIDADLPGPVATTLSDVTWMINNSDKFYIDYAEKIAEAREKYCALDDGLASKRVVEKLLSINDANSIP